MPRKKKPAKRRKWINIRYIDSKKSKNKKHYKPAADLIDWMRREGFDRERLLRESDEIRDYVGGELSDPYFFTLDDILDMKGPPAVYKKHRFIKKEERKEVSYFSYIVHRQAYELLLWHLIVTNFPQQSKDYYRGRLRPEAIKRKIVIGQVYWVRVNRDIPVYGPVRVLGWDGNVARCKTVHTRNKEYDTKIPVERFRF